MSKDGIFINIFHCSSQEIFYEFLEIFTMISTNNVLSVEACEGTLTLSCANNVWVILFTPF